MKKKLILFFAAVILAAVATAVTYTKQNARIDRITQQVVYDPETGAVSAVNVDAYFVVRLVNDADASDVAVRPKVQVSYNLLDPDIASTNITAAGKTVTYQQLAALQRQAALDRANAAGVQ